MNEQHLQAYIRAVDKIQDHFEYANESLKDRAYVYKVLAELTEDLVEASKHLEAEVVYEYAT